MVCKKKFILVVYKYIGFKVQVLCLVSGVKVVNLVELFGECLEYMLKYYFELQYYFVLFDVVEEE